MSVKEKVINALQGSLLESFSEDALIDLLVDKVVSQSKEIKELKCSSIVEKIKLKEQKEEMHNEIHRIRNNPMTLANIETYFLGKNDKLFFAKFYMNECYLSEISKGYHFEMKRISTEEFRQRMR